MLLSRPPRALLCPPDSLSLSCQRSAYNRPLSSSAGLLFLPRSLLEKERSHRLAHPHHPPPLRRLLCSGGQQAEAVPPPAVPWVDDTLPFYPRIVDFSAAKEGHIVRRTRSIPFPGCLPFPSSRGSAHPWLPLLPQRPPSLARSAFSSPASARLFAAAYVQAQCSTHIARSRPRAPARRALLSAPGACHALPSLHCAGCTRNATAVARGRLRTGQNLSCLWSGVHPPPHARPPRPLGPPRHTLIHARAHPPGLHD